MAQIDLSSSKQLFERASQVVPGGVTSSVRAGGRPHPLYFERGDGAYLWDVDGNRYVDFVLAFGPSILGHAPGVVQAAVAEQAQRAFTFGSQHRSEVRVAEMLVESVPSAEMAILSTTGSEAVAVALRLARAYTNRSKVVKFEGHYHGWYDGTFASGGYDPARSGSADRPSVVPATAGIAPGALQDLLVAPWNDPAAVDGLFAERGNEIAALILEPVNVNGGVILPAPGFLQHVREVTRRYGALLIFDEVITGFRIALGGAQAHYGVEADLAIFAKAVAGGLPLSAVTGPREIMNVIASGRMIHNGTFNGSALAAAAAEATLRYLIDNAAEIYPRFETLGIRLAQGLASTSPDVVVRQVGPIVMTAFDEPAEVRTIRDRATSDVGRAARLSEGLLYRGVHARPIWYLSTAHTEREVDMAVSAVADVLGESMAVHS